VEFIGSDAEAGCGYICIMACVGMCVLPPFYMVATSDDVAWASILADPQQ
jgi:hypothetical protein